MSAAKPLTAEEVFEIVEEGHKNLLEVIDGDVYNSEDLYQCGSCYEFVAVRSNLDEDGLCETCLDQIQQEMAHQEELRADYRASVL